MKIAIFSDIHLGFQAGTEREDDPFHALEEALEKTTDCDAILLPGDLFHSKKPPPETNVRAIELLFKPLTSPDGAEIAEGIDKDLDSLPPLSGKNGRGIPVIALHGNHERRSKDLLNPVQALERTGFLIHLHCNGLILKKKNGKTEEKVAVQGMSAVPDRYASTVLKNWDPEPKEDCYNIFLFHQILKGLYPSDTQLEPGEIPQGFDIYIDGDIHQKKQTELNGQPLLIAGSLIPTQLTKEETQEKGLWKLDTRENSLDFVPLENQRKFYWKEFEKPDREEIEDWLEEILENKHQKKPLVRIKLKEKFSGENQIKDRFGDRALISFRKDIQTEEMESVELGEHRLSVRETGRKLLRENLSRAGLPEEAFENLFELLLEKKDEKALETLNQLKEEPKEPEKKTTEEGKEKEEKEKKTEEKSSQPSEKQKEEKEKPKTHKRERPKNLEEFF